AGGGQLQLSQRQTAGGTFGREKTSIRLADNLSGGVAIDLLGPTTPGEDAAISVEHENGVIGHALNHQAKLFFGYTHSVLGALLFRDVPRDGCVAVDVSRGIQQEEV